MHLNIRISLLLLACLIISDSADAFFLKFNKKNKSPSAQDDLAEQSAHDSSMSEMNSFFDTFAKRLLHKKKPAANLKTDDEVNEEQPQPESGDDENYNDYQNSHHGGGGAVMPANQASMNDFYVNVGGGKKVNICDQKFFALATMAHEKIRDIWMAICSGHSGATWIISKFLKSKMPA